MIQLLDPAVAAARRLPTEAQDGMAREALLLAGEQGGPVPLSPDERVAVQAGRAAQGDPASEAEVRDLLAQHGARGSALPVNLLRT